jgi:hypothetical protein
MTRNTAIEYVRDYSEDDSELPDNLTELYMAVFGIPVPSHDDAQTAWSELCAAAEADAE